MSIRQLIAIVMLVQITIVTLGVIFMGERFAALSIFHAPVVNLLLWTGLITLATLALSMAKRPVHRRMCLVLVIAAVAWFPISLLIFGNARFSGTSAFLWQTWLWGSALLVVGSLASLFTSAVSGLSAPRRKS